MIYVTVGRCVMVQGRKARRVRINAGQLHMIHVKVGQLHMIHMIHVIQLLGNYT
jgi:hypothetical protein